MAEWSSVYRKWEKGPDDKANVSEFKKHIEGLSDNKHLTKSLLTKANMTFNEASHAYPALDRILFFTAAMANFLMSRSVLSCERVQYTNMFYTDLSAAGPAAPPVDPSAAPTAAGGAATRTAPR